MTKLALVPPLATGVQSYSDGKLYLGQSAEAAPAPTYADKVLATGPIAYWILGEAAGAVAADQINSPAQDGAAVGVTWGQPGIGDGNTAPQFDKINDYINIYSVALDAAFDGQEGTVMVWFKVRAASVWTDGSFAYPVIIRVNGSNQLFFQKTNANNTLQWYYEANNVVEARTKAGVVTTDWIALGLTWSVAADEVIAYYNGVQEGAIMTVLGAWAGALSNTDTVIGASSTVPGNIVDGYVAHTIVWDTPLPPVTMLSLASPTP